MDASWYESLKLFVDRLVALFFSLPTCPHVRLPPSYLPASPPPLPAVKNPLGRMLHFFELNDSWVSFLLDADDRKDASLLQLQRWRLRKNLGHRDKCHPTWKRVGSVSSPTYCLITSARL